jgi:hypothetical protein
MKWIIHIGKEEWMIEIPIIKSAFDIYAKHYHSLGDYSATTIIDSPRRVALFRRYGEGLTYTPESQAASLVGTAVHEKVEKLLVAANVLHPDYIVEKGMAIPWEMTDGNVLLLGGKPDVIIPGLEQLTDIKTCKTWKIIFDPEKEEWTKQTNVYRYMLMDKGIQINKITVVAFFLDWVEGQAMQRHDYPKEPIMEYNINVWPIQETFEFICDRMKAHYECEQLPDDELPPCTKEEMWEDDTKFALMKDQNAKKAMKVFHDATSLTEAVEMASQMPKVSADSFIEIRHGTRKRCNKFCAVNEHCNLYVGDKKRVDIFQLGGVL